MKGGSRLAAGAAVAGFLAVAGGAFGAHGLEADPRAAELMRTAATYAMWHALAVLGYLALGGTGRLAPLAFLTGILVFSGTVAALALGGPRLLGAVTPFGGLMLLVGWLVVVVEALRGRLPAPGRR